MSHFASTAQKGIQESNTFGARLVCIVDFAFDGFQLSWVSILWLGAYAENVISLCAPGVAGQMRGKLAP